jgi:UDP-glucose 4-epimerase
MRIGITGGAGFIGTNLTLSLKQAGHEVRIIDDLFNSNLDRIKELNVDFINESITNLGAVVEFTKNLDFIVHLAARGSVPRSIEDPIGTFNANVNGTLNILQSIRSSKTPMIFTSSSSVYGVNPKTPKNETDWLLPISPYAASKLNCESLISAWSHSYDLKILTFRLFNVFGPFQRADSPYSAVMPRWSLSAIKRGEIEIFGDGTQLRDFTFVEDVVKTIQFSIENQISHIGPINLSFNRKISIKELSLIFKDMVPNLQISHLAVRHGDIKDSLSDGKLLRELFPKISSSDFKKSVSETFNWIRENY